jgi:carboxyl-terminal processing protease
MKTHSLLSALVLIPLFFLVLPGCSPSQAATPAAFNGIWKSDGYGRVLQVAGNDMRLYQETPYGLMPTNEAAVELRESYAEVSLPSADIAITRNALEQADYRWQRLSSLPAGVLRPSRLDAAEGLEVALWYLQNHYAFADEWQVNWSARAQIARSKITASSSGSQLRQVLVEMLSGVGDAHLRVIWEEGGALNWGPGFTSRETIPALVAAGARPGEYGGTAFAHWRVTRMIEAVNRMVATGGQGWAGGRLMWHRADGIGYLMINDMMGYSASSTLAADMAELSQAMDAAFTYLAGVDEVIVDITLNGGGRAAISRAIASRFATAITPVYARLPHGASIEALQQFSIGPTGRPGFSGPVRLVTSDITTSAGEDFVLAMRALPNVVHYGTATHGSMSDMLVVPLPFDLALGLSNEVYRDVNNEVWEGRGIYPDVVVPVITAATLYTNHFDRIMELADTLTTDPAPAPEPEPDPQPEPEPIPGALESGIFNLSTRGWVGSGEDTMVSGLIIAGEGTRDLAIIAKGPSLAEFGVNNVVEDVRINVLDADLESIGSAQSLADLGVGQRAELTAFGILPSHADEAVVVLRDVPAGMLHVHVSAEGAGVGVGLVEIFDITDDADSETALFNLSTRGRVRTGTGVMIAGFVIGGDEDVTVLIRGRGPSLADFGVSEALGDPFLQLLPLGGTEPLALNEDYGEIDAELRALLEDAGLGLNHADEAAIAIELPPGAYTAILAAEPGEPQGVGLVEFFIID